MNKHCSRIVKAVGIVTVAGVMSFTTGCGGSGSNTSGTSVTSKVTAQGMLQVGSDGKTAQTSITAPPGSTLTLAVGTVFSNNSSAVVSAGTIPTTVTTSASPDDLPAEALAAFPGDIVFLMDVDLGPIKNVDPPMSLKMTLPGAAAGSTVDVYSFDSSVSAWSLEKSALVVAPDGTVSFNSDHPSKFASSIHQNKLTISGTPTIKTPSDSLYSFVPTTSDSNQNAGPLLFTISNKPTWASFDAASGALTGTPTDLNVGTTSGIVICVSDKYIKSCTSRFSITVYQPSGTGGGGSL